ncbi:hypothetical protein C2S52_004264 [Perilla frutescens var. hirtella]|uniref:Prothymosin alpha-related family protein n=1 Tax=Perilla frutescens var. hirtella TaxID=608512 RepID=A0AAD4J4J6_PERFH|nr:hypothetical protein C2S51_011303 [Perilla frutescens var. frutescens]KAH6793787.1 hypothetical protein C2S52_004264 [Perilla frutescens var. hirtella]KAH6827024.1 hypothetical protein C2S53_016167 [Perilla frutescens var. hirtella]
MENEKEGDIRVPLVFTVFFLCVTTGGIFLLLYVFAPSVSQPWYPAAALVLIGAPWIFWLLTYVYTIIKRCCAASRRPPDAGAVDHQISRRPSTANGSSREPEMPLTSSV